MSEDPKLLNRDDQDEVDEDYDPQAEVVGNWKLCDLPEIPVVTGEEEEDTVAKFKSKIYRWRGQWKQRGVGELKFLKHKKTGLVRVLVRAEKTHKCVMNHFLQAKQIFCKLEQMKTSNNAWSWAAYDISDQKPESQKFCAKFTSKEDFDSFKTEFDKAVESNGKILDEKKAGQPEEQKPQESKEAEADAKKQ